MVAELLVKGGIDRPVVNGGINPRLWLECPYGAGRMMVVEAD